MNKSDERKIEQARREGMEYALRIVKRSGADGLEKELKFRQRTQIPLAVHPDVARECVENIKMQTCDCFAAMGCLSCIDLFKGHEYSIKMAKQWRRNFMAYTERLTEGEFNWQDLVDELANLGVYQQIRLNDLDAVNRPLEDDQMVHRKVGSV